MDIRLKLGDAPGFMLFREDGNMLKNISLVMMLILGLLWPRIILGLFINNVIKIVGRLKAFR